MTKDRINEIWSGPVVQRLGIAATLLGVLVWLIHVGYGDTRAELERLHTVILSNHRKILEMEQIIIENQRDIKRLLSK